jgi:hypothetical protein
MMQISFGENNRYSLSPSFFYTRTYNKDVDGGDWGDGLYNYEDVGGGLDFRMRGSGHLGEIGTAKLGVQYYKREYPNFRSLLDLATGIGVEEDERDYRGILAKAGYSRAKSEGFSWGADYYLLYKDLVDKKVVNENGVLTDEEQRDYAHNVDLVFWFVPQSARGLRLGIDLNGHYYESNQNYYDARGTLTFEDDLFLPDFYDFWAYRVRPNLSYRFQGIPLTVTLSYSFGWLKYTERLAQDEAGGYKDDEQWEREHLVTFGLRYALTPSVSLYTHYRYLEVESNNDFTDVYQYQHTVNYLYGGVSIRF